MAATTPPSLDRIFAAMSVDVEAFAICDFAADACIMVPPLDMIEVHFVLEGTFHLRVPGSQAIVLEAGGVVVVPPGLRQTMAGSTTAKRILHVNDICGARSDGLVLYDAGGKYPGARIMCGAIHASVSGSFGLFDGLTAPLHAQLRNEPLVAAAVEAMLSECATPAPGGKALTSALMKTVLIMLLRSKLSAHDGFTKLPNLLSKPQIARAVATVLEHPTAGHTVASLAAAAGMSRSNFAKKFVAALEVTPMEFVAQVRIARGRDLLMSTALPVSEVATNAGFASRSHFSRSFRRAFGTRPSTFRRGTSEKNRANAD